LKDRFGLLDRRLFVVDVDPRAARTGVDLDAALLEEAADAADQALAATRDHRLGTELGADPRQQLLQRFSPVGLHLRVGRDGGVGVGAGALDRVGGGQRLGHTWTTPMFSTRTPGTISL
jgi:hypothetical protein